MNTIYIARGKSDSSKNALNNCVVRLFIKLIYRHEISCEKISCLYILTIVKIKV